MARRFQIRRLSTGPRRAETPAPGEPVLDLDTRALHLGDGETPGGGRACLTPEELAAVYAPRQQTNFSAPQGAGVIRLRHPGAGTWHTLRLCPGPPLHARARPCANGGDPPPEPVLTLESAGREVPVELLGDPEFTDISSPPRYYRQRMLSGHLALCFSNDGGETSFFNDGWRGRMQSGQPRVDFISWAGTPGSCGFYIGDEDFWAGTKFSGQFLTVLEDWLFDEFSAASVLPSGLTLGDHAALTEERTRRAIVGNEEWLEPFGGEFYRLSGELEETLSQEDTCASALARVPVEERPPWSAWIPENPALPLGSGMTMPDAAQPRQRVVTERKWRLTVTGLPPGAPRLLTWLAAGQPQAHPFTADSGGHYQFETTVGPCSEHQGWAIEPAT